jgi:hypothetical protein
MKLAALACLIAISDHVASFKAYVQPENFVRVQSDTLNNVICTPYWRASMPHLNQPACGMHELHRVRMNEHHRLAIFNSLKKL